MIINHPYAIETCTAVAQNTLKDLAGCTDRLISAVFIAESDFYLQVCLLFLTYSYREHYI